MAPARPPSMKITIPIGAFSVLIGTASIGVLHPSAVLAVAFGQNGLFVLLHFINPAHSDRHAFLRAVVIPDGRPRQGFQFFQQSQPPRVVHACSSFRNVLKRFEQGNQQGLQHVARAGHPGGDAVDACVEIVQPDVNPVDLAAADQLFGDGLKLVVQDDHVVAVPADRPADVQQQLRAEHQDGRNFFGDHFGGMKVPGVEAQQFLAGDRIAQIKFMGADRIAFRANAEEL